MCRRPRHSASPWPVGMQRTQVVTRVARRLDPKRVKRTLKTRYEVWRSRVELWRLKRDFRKRYGRGLVYSVHDHDEMFRFISQFWNWRYHVVPMKAQSDAFRTYLISGDLTSRDLESVLRDHGRDLSQVASLLEFAS